MLWLIGCGEAFQPPVACRSGSEVDLGSYCRPSRMLRPTSVVGMTMEASFLEDVIVDKGYITWI